MLLLIGLAALFLAFSNGANDNFKGFATVWGSGALSYRTALYLATIATLAGSIFSLLLAGELVRAFSGAGLLPDDLAATPEFMAGVGIGAALTVFTATRTGFPVSTTHALLGGIIGSGFALAGMDIDLQLLGSTFLLPLLLSPVLAAALGIFAYRTLRLFRSDADCLCIVEPASAVEARGGTMVDRSSALPLMVVASAESCDKMATPSARLSMAGMLDQLHILSAASICFARSVNDTPKLAALLLAADASGLQSMMAVALAMTAGGLLLARHVAETMSHRLSDISVQQGLSANLITAGLVLFASKFEVPVSTTHVSVGSIAGAGAGARTVDWAVARNILFSWLATLPLAGVAGWICASLLISI